MTLPAQLASIEVYSPDLGLWFGRQPQHAEAMQYYNAYEESLLGGRENPNALLENIGNLENFLFYALIVPDFADAQVSMHNLAAFPNAPALNPAVSGYLLENKPSLEWLDAPHKNGVTAFHNVRFQLSQVNTAIDNYNEAITRLKANPNLDRAALHEAASVYVTKLAEALGPLRNYLGESRQILASYIMRHDEVMDNPDSTYDQKMRLQLAIYCEEMVIPAIHAQIDHLAAKAIDIVHNVNDLENIDPEVTVLASSASNERAGQNPTAPLDEAELEAKGVASLAIARQRKAEQGQDDGQNR